MAEIADSGGGGGGKHHKKGRKKAGNPRVDMTPMVDLAFLLLTFFVLTSNLNKAKTLELAVPKDKDPNDTTHVLEIDSTLANTFLIDGNKDGIVYVYAGKFNPNKQPPANLFEKTFDPKNPDESLRGYILAKNTKVSSEMKTLRTIYKAGALSQGDFDKLSAILKEKSQPNALDDSIVASRKQKSYDTAMVRLKMDLTKGAMSDTTYKLVSGNIRADDKAPFFIIKWGGDAKYADVINVIDELKIGDASKYALVKISVPELQLLQTKTHRNYPELKGLAPSP